MVTITDVEPWRGMPAGLLDAQGQPKPVYHVLDELINEEWHTEKRGLLSEDGRLRFRGFYGTYAILVEHEGVWFEGTFVHEKETKDVQRVELSHAVVIGKIDWIKKMVVGMKICVTGLVWGMTLLSFGLAVFRAIHDPIF